MRKRKLRRRCKRLVGGVLFGGVLLRCPLEGDSLLFVSLLFGALHPIHSELILKEELEMELEEEEEEEEVVVVVEVVVEVEAAAGVGP